MENRGGGYRYNIRGIGGNEFPRIWGVLMVPSSIVATIVATFINIQYWHEFHKKDKKMVLSCDGYENKCYFNDIKNIYG